MKWIPGNLLFPLFFLIQGCSFSVRFYIINNGDAARTVKIEMKKEKTGQMIFSPFNLHLYPVAANEIDFESRRSYSVNNAGEVHEIVIPGHTALEIGHLNNEKFESSKQNFINGRVFNFIRAQSGKSEVTRDTFEANFKKFNAGYAWQLPAE